MAGYEEEKHLLKVVLFYAVVTFVLLAVAIGVLGLGLGLLAGSAMP
jgi:hypothetical protein